MSTTKRRCKHCGHEMKKTEYWCNDKRRPEPFLKTNWYCPPCGNKRRRDNYWKNVDRERKRARMAKDAEFLKPTLGRDVDVQGQMYIRGLL